MPPARTRPPLPLATRDVAASYGVGALGGLVYLRLLARSVDAVGGGGIGGALGQPRLLIPIILALGYNRHAGLGCNSLPACLPGHLAWPGTAGRPAALLPAWRPPSAPTAPAPFR